MEENKNFQVTVNDASKTTYLDGDGNPIPETVAVETGQPAEEKSPKKK